jgi:ribonuclease HII
MPELLPIFNDKGWIEAGCDEAGRGCLAGSVYAAAVILPPDYKNERLNDSKQLSAKRRYALREEIERDAVAWALGVVTAEEIDRINILEATKKAMREAAAQVPADIFLIDAVTGLGLNGQEVPIIKGDATSYAIAAASIVAKVTRDRQMQELDKLYPQYGFARNKGYGTAEHIAALKRYGPCPAHRRSFIRGILERQP